MVFVLMLLYIITLLYILHNVVRYYLLSGINLKNKTFTLKIFKLLLLINYITFSHLFKDRDIQ